MYVSRTVSRAGTRRNCPEMDGGSPEMDGSCLEVCGGAFEMGGGCLGETHNAETEVKLSKAVESPNKSMVDGGAAPAGPLFKEKQSGNM